MNTWNRSRLIILLYCTFLRLPTYVHTHKKVVGRLVRFANATQGFQNRKMGRMCKSICTDIFRMFSVGTEIHNSSSPMTRDDTAIQRSGDQAIPPRVVECVVSLSALLYYVSSRTTEINRFPCTARTPAFVIFNF